MQTTNQPPRIIDWINQHFGLVSLGVLLSVIGIGSYVILWPQYVHVRDVSYRNYAVGAGAVNELQADVDEIAAIVKDYEAMDKRSYRLMDRVIPPAQESSQLFEEFEQFFKDSPFQLVSINVTSTSTPAIEPGSEVVVEPAAEFNFGELADQTAAESVDEHLSDMGVDTIQLSLNVQGGNGTYQEFKDMLNQIEQYTRILDLETVTFSSGNNSYTLVITTYQQSSNFSTVQ